MAKKQKPKHVLTVAQCFGSLDGIVGQFPQKRAEGILFAYFLRRLLRLQSEGKLVKGTIPSDLSPIWAEADAGALAKVMGTKKPSSKTSS